MSMSESVTEFSEVLPPYFPPPTSWSVRVEGVVVVVGSWGATDSGAWKASGQHFAGSGPIGLSCELELLQLLLMWIWAY